jgi:hypothetical protein
MIHLRKNKLINLASVAIGDRYLAPTESGIAAMTKSLETRGQINPITVRLVTGSSYRLVAGATRFEAAKRLGWKHIRADIVAVDDEREYKIIEIEENLERRDLTPEQRREMRAKVEEYQRELMKDVAPAKGGRGQKGGLREAARQAGINETTARRRVGKLRQNIESDAVSTKPKSAKGKPKRKSKSKPIDPRLLLAIARGELGDACLMALEAERTAGSAEIPAEQRKAEMAALDGDAAQVGQAGQVEISAEADKAQGTADLAAGGIEEHPPAAITADSTDVAIGSFLEALGADRFFNALQHAPKLKAEIGRRMLGQEARKHAKPEQKPEFKKKDQPDLDGKKKPEPADFATAITKSEFQDAKRKGQRPRQKGHVETKPPKPEPKSAREAREQSRARVKKAIADMAGNGTVAPVQETGINGEMPEPEPAPQVGIGNAALKPDHDAIPGAAS